MDLLLDEQQTLLAETAARLCAAAGGPKRLRELKNAGEEIDHAAWRGLVDAGWLSTVVAERHGGNELGAFELALLIEQVGRHLLLVPLLEAAASARIMSTAESAASAGMLADLLAGKRLIVAALGTASASSGSRARAGFDPARSRLSAAAPLVSFARSADAFLVALEAAPDAVICLVPRDADGLAVASTANIDGSFSGRLDLDMVEISDGNVLATGAQARRLIVHLQELLLLGAGVELLGVAAAAHEVALDYIKLRHQFGRPIGSFQVLQHRAVDAFIDLELNRSLAYRVISAFDAGEHDPAMVTAVKARTSRCALELVRGALQMHGAVGYTDTHDIGLYYKRAVTLAARYGGELEHESRFSQLTVAVDEP